ncbi:MAG TPA: hypothetical protein VFS24_13590, partial [Steroidobacteraceae bacterium]|nr:hypothetical protein [Steroidobacteraceae bacterium]
HFEELGDPFTMVFQLTTFQGVRYALFNYNVDAKAGGVADFDSFEVLQPDLHGLMRPIPFGKTITLTSFGSEGGIGSEGGHLSEGAPTPFAVVDLGLGRVALRAGGKTITIAQDGRAKLDEHSQSQASAFQWMETPTGELVLMSLVTNRYLRIDPQSHTIVADSPGPLPDATDGVRFVWSLVQ